LAGLVPFTTGFRSRRIGALDEAPRVAGAFTSRRALGYNATMHRRANDFSTLSSHALALVYARTFAGFLLLMGGLWVIGLEGIYGHPTPFYAVFAPEPGLASSIGLSLLLLLAGWRLIGAPVPGKPLPFYGALLTIIAVLWLLLLVPEARDAGELFRRYVRTRFPALAWQLPTMAVMAGGAFLLRRHLLPALASDRDLDHRTVRRVLLGLFGFSVLFACSIAMIRDGFGGIDQAYSRTAYEYIGDIGKTNGIRALFTRYLEIHEHLSMHAKVHPPGPIALLWILSLFLFSSSPMTLSLATVFFSALAIFPLYGWVKRIAGQRCALIAVICYALAPSIVLFTATSADALFTPFTLSTLYCFERAIRTRSARFALLAGAGYGCMILLKFSLIGIGVYFGLVGLWMLLKPETRWNVVQTAALMIVATLGVIGLVYLWSGFNIVETFHVAKSQFDTDQRHLDDLAPRLPAWTYRFLNPLCWFYFAGIPLSLLAIREVFRGEKVRRATWIIVAFTLLVLNLLYLARGEGERSAMYMIPFMVLPAAYHLERWMASEKSGGALWVTALFLMFQCWFTETFFYTYW
jgi:4-amino-4-deoxy-L-arabinose transferase-like glycosyltransferase